MRALASGGLQFLPMSESYKASTMYLVVHGVNNTLFSVACAVHSEIPPR